MASGERARLCANPLVATAGSGHGGAGNLVARSTLVNYAPATIATRPRHVSARFDLVLLASTMVLAVGGVIIIYSATRGNLSLARLDPHYLSLIHI